MNFCFKFVEATLYVNGESLYINNTIYTYIYGYSNENNFLTGRMFMYQFDSNSPDKIDLMSFPVSQKKDR